ncbi:MAG: 30S ribosomal protein S4 [Nitrospinota bacterium]|nr:30S ribosomal protein S4 [Nitrospinota bacterium]
MARYRGSVCRLCRREGIKLFLKSERCVTAKCAIEKRAYAPGVHGQSRRRKFSEYGVQLREKQKVRRIYGVLEKQFRSYFAVAERKKGVTGENLLQTLELRFDNVAYRLGFAGSRNAARQMVRHNHLMINGKRVNIPSCILKQGDVIAPAANKLGKKLMQATLEKMKTYTHPQWLAYDPEKNQGIIQTLPTREDITLPIEEQLIVELYSR